MITKDQNETNLLCLILIFSLILLTLKIVERNAKILPSQSNQSNQGGIQSQQTNRPGVNRSQGVQQPTGALGEFVRPVDGRITSDFGLRIHPTLGTSRMHQGMDLAAAVGTPVKSPWNGVIDSKVDDGVCGLGIRIKHPNGFLTVYCHLSDNNVVSEGAQVTAGQEIAKSGNTGRSSGPHLHWGVKKDDVYVNPIDYWK